MPQQDAEDKPDYLSAGEMRQWLARETTDTDKARELRLREANTFVDAYERGEISAPEAAVRHAEYSARWGNILPGILRTQGMTDEQIIERVNETRIRQGLLDKRVLSRGSDDPKKPSR